MSFNPIAGVGDGIVEKPLVSILHVMIFYANLQVFLILGILNFPVNCKIFQILPVHRTGILGVRKECRNRNNNIAASMISVLCESKLSWSDLLLENSTAERRNYSLLRISKVLHL